MAGGLKAYEEYSFTVTVCNRQGCVSSPPASGRTLPSGQYYPYNLHPVYLASSLWCYVFHFLNLSFSFMSFTDWFKILFQQCYIIPDKRTNPIQTIRTNPNCSTFKNSRFIMEYTHSMRVWALNIQLRVSTLIYVVVERQKTWIGVNSYVNINEVPLMESVCHCS